MQVIKRRGDREPLDLDKVHAVLDWACNGKAGERFPRIKGVSVSEIEMKAQLQFFESITTKQIHETLIKACISLISEDTPNYDHVAGRLRWFAVRKEAFGTNTPPPLYDIVKKNTRRGIYDPDLIHKYTRTEWDTIDSFIDHDRDDLFRSAGADQMYLKYLAQNRKTKKIYESFQIPYILVAATLFAGYPKETRLDYVRRFYDIISQHYLSLPTPIMAGLRTKTKQFSSCVLIESDDTLKSINATSSAIVDYASNRAGIGVNIGGIRAAGQLVRNGDAVSTGVVPFAKYFAAALKSCSQGAVRGASATFNYPIWHLEFDNLIELKNNKGTEETRLRVVDYCVQLNRTMYQRLAKKENITFFSPEEVPDLYQAYFGDASKFEELYVKYEADPSITKKVRPAIEVFSKLITERFDTGRIYIMNVDIANTHTPLLEPIRMTNLCVEVMQHTSPLVGKHDEPETGLIALCTLAAFNFGKIETEAQIKEVSELAVRALDSLLDYQNYPHPAARAHTSLYRPIGIGIIGLAHYLARKFLTWGSKDAVENLYTLMETYSYYTTRASVDLAIEKGSCPVKTKLHQGIFPMELSSQYRGVTTTLPWEQLREDMKKYGIRNATLFAGMPGETSSMLSNEPNGVEPVKGLITIKGNKDSVFTQVVPGINSIGHAYQRVWDVSVGDYLKTLAPLQVFIDQAISSNTSYDPSKTKITTGLLMSDILLAYKLGFKTLYYNNTRDGAGEEETIDEGCVGGCKL